MDASILLRRDSKIMLGGRGIEGPGRERGVGGKIGAGSGMGRDRRVVQRVRNMYRNM